MVLRIYLDRGPWLFRTHALELHVKIDNLLRACACNQPLLILLSSQRKTAPRLAGELCFSSAIVSSRYFSCASGYSRPSMSVSLSSRTLMERFVVNKDDGRGNWAI